MHKINARRKATDVSCNGAHRGTHTAMDEVEDVVFELAYQNGFAVNSEFLIDKTVMLLQSTP